MATKSRGRIIFNSGTKWLSIIEDPKPGPVGPPSLKKRLPATGPLSTAANEAKTIRLRTGMAPEVILLPLPKADCYWKDSKSATNPPKSGNRSAMLSVTKIPIRQKATMVCSSGSETAETK